MGAGALFISIMMEMMVPTLLVFPICYAAFRSKWRLKAGWLRQLGAFFAAFLVGGLVYAAICTAAKIGTASAGDGMDQSLALMWLIPLAISPFAIRMLVRKTDAADEGWGE